LSVTLDPTGLFMPSVIEIKYKKEKKIEREKEKKTIPSYLM